MPTSSPNMILNQTIKLVFDLFNTNQTIEYILCLSLISSPNMDLNKKHNQTIRLVFDLFNINQTIEYILHLSLISSPNMDLNKKRNQTIRLVLIHLIDLLNAIKQLNIFSSF